MEARLENVHALRVKFLRAWVDSSGKIRKNGVALPMLAMETEMKTQWTTRGSKGFTLTELLVVICVVAVLVVVFLPSLAGSHKSSLIACVNNLRQIGLAFRVWEGDNSDEYPMQFAVTNDATMRLVSGGNAYVLWQTMSNELSIPKILVCPVDTKHVAAINFTTDFSDANISYFISLNVDNKYPQMFFSGDDNFAVNGKPVQSGILNLWTNASVGWTKERHRGAGYIALVDGSVRTTGNLTLKSALVNTGTATNRLVIP